MKILIRKEKIKKDLPQVLSLIKEFVLEHEVTIFLDDLKKDERILIFRT